MENQKNNIIRNDKYGLDHTHDDAETQTTPSEDYTIENPNMATTGYVIEEEYEQLKRKNRRRLVGAGALVLIAGGLFAAASHKVPHATPTLAPETKAPVVTNVTTDILVPGNGKTTTNAASIENVVVDDSKNAPISMSHKIQAAAPLSDEEKSALAARQQRAKAQRLAQQRKLEAERAEHENNNDITTNNTLVSSNKINTPDDDSPRKKSSPNVKAEPERKTKDNTSITTARDTQGTVDKTRVTDRTKLASNKTNSVTSNKTNNNTTTTASNSVDREKAAQEKLRAQRQAAEREKATSSKLTTTNPPTTTVNGKVTVQAGAFSDKALAQKIQQQLKSLNYSSHLEEVQTAKGSVYRVKTGKFANQNEAKGAIERLKNSGINGVVVIGQ